MLSFISKILSQHVALLAATRISPCSALSKCCIHSHSGLSTLLHIVLVATRRASCRNTHFSVLRTLEMLHTFAFRAIDASPYRSCRNTSCFLSQHAFLRASHSRNAAYIRIPGYRRFSTLVCRNTSCFLSQHAFLCASHSRNAAYIRIPGYRPTCSCMFDCLIDRSLSLQAVT